MNTPPSKSGPLRVAVIGAGKMGLQHVNAIRTVPNAIVVGIADPVADEDALRPALPEGAVIARSLDQLFDEAKPDVVHIVTPPSTHRSLAEAAIERGAHVYVEKPFALSVVDAAAVLDKARNANRLVCAGHQCLYQSNALAARRHIDLVGPIVNLDSHFAFRQVRRQTRPVEQAKDILPHAVYPVVEFMGAGAPPAPLTIDYVSARGDGSAFVRLSRGAETATINVTLVGRPVEHFLRITGRNGTVRVDFSSGAKVALVGPGAGVGAMLAPFQTAWQTYWGSARGLYSKIANRKRGYPGLAELSARFYTAILNGEGPPFTDRAILDTIAICERVGHELDAADAAEEARSRALLEERTAALAAPTRPMVVVTGGSGFLGRPVVRQLRQAGHAVRSASRRVPRFADQEPGVEYVECDLAKDIPETVTRGASCIVHCAAETAGGKRDQEQNSIAATQFVLDAALAAGIKKVIYISSLAVLKSGASVLDETTPVDGDLRRGPYVWGKAAAENLAMTFARQHQLDVPVLRPGPLVDFDRFTPPGRLGRELGPVYMAVGPKGGPLSVCSTETAASVIRLYVGQDGLPAVVNLVEAQTPTRAELVTRLTSGRRDLRVMWLPFWVLQALTPIANVAQRLLLGAATPVSIAGAFASERYGTAVAASVIERARAGAEASTAGPPPAAG